MKKIFFVTAALPLFLSTSSLAAKECVCKCVTNESGKIFLTYGKGKDRQAAGEDLKKNLKKNKCELTPVCEGGCAP